MLSMLLLLAAAPQSAIPPMPPAPVPGAQGTMRVVGQTLPACAPVTTPINDPTTGNGLLWRGGQDSVALYRLLERRVNGCPAPIIVNYRVPGSNAVGREVGPAPRR
ncbi:hypothetical protein [Brevundimonas sp. NIBR11]|uniref:hypothetical protein n=1 Tax=Brevundimonas sp. NIBR11 TaxID=3015999 RepID=UPI0022F0D883|nr:hypothetical protein [Brevundimonas sp. NIBR11]WGM32829.1 hypothetical protein KKHFBJBL_03084 [Brevundimonas sp. NIBR11]